MRLEPSDGQARGIEVFLKHERGRRLNWWFSYGFASAKNQIEKIELASYFEGIVEIEPAPGDPVYRSFDQTHAVSGNVTYRPNDAWSLSVAWVFHTGFPFTEASTHPGFRDDGTETNLLEVGVVNGKRASNFHRMDLRLSRNYSFSRSNLTVFLEFLNLYNRKNIRRTIEHFDSDPSSSTPVSQDERTWASFIPSLGIRWDLYH